MPPRLDARGSHTEDVTACRQALLRGPLSGGGEQSRGLTVDAERHRNLGYVPRVALHESEDPNGPFHFEFDPAIGMSGKKRVRGPVQGKIRLLNFRRTIDLIAKGAIETQHPPAGFPANDLEGPRTTGHVRYVPVQVFGTATVMLRNS